MWEDRFNKLEAVMKNTNQNNSAICKRKTTLHAEEGKQEIHGNKGEFDLPLELHKAYTEADIC